MQLSGTNPPCRIVQIPPRFTYLHAQPRRWHHENRKMEETHTHSFSLTQLHKTRTTISLLSICSITLLSKNVLIFLEREKFELCPKPRERTHTHTHTHTNLCVWGVNWSIIFFSSYALENRKRWTSDQLYYIFDILRLQQFSSIFWEGPASDFSLVFKLWVCVSFSAKWFFFGSLFHLFFFARWGTQSRI